MQGAVQVCTSFVSKFWFETIEAAPPGTLIPAMRLVQPFTAPVLCEATVTAADADLVVSATLVAVTVKVPVEFGAVNSPAVLMVPPVVLHVTAVSELPVTVAANCCVAPVNTLADVGLIVTETGCVPVGVVKVTSPLVEVVPPELVDCTWK